MKTKPMTDLELQLWLAARLPEQLQVFQTADKSVWWIYPYGTGPVKDTEWDYIVRRIEQGLSDYCGENGEHDSQREQFALALLRQVATWPDNFHWGSQCDADFYKVANASWQQRARALTATLGEKKGEK